jgi:hypothetical protein
MFSGIKFWPIVVFFIVIGLLIGIILTLGIGWVIQHVRIILQ